MGARLMAVVAAGDHGRVYLKPTADTKRRRERAVPEWGPDIDILPDKPRFPPAITG